MILLKLNGITGWRRHLRSLPGRPDFAFPRSRAAVFVDGCFWHGCTKCRRNLRPLTHREYWEEKFAANRRRDGKVDGQLRKKGWRVVRIWEHDVKKRPTAVINRITTMIKRTATK